MKHASTGRITIFVARCKTSKRKNGTAMPYIPADRVRRTDAIQVACPQCAAQPGQPCIGARLNQRISCHHPRHHAAITAGYPPLNPGEPDPTTITRTTQPTQQARTQNRRNNRNRRRPAQWTTYPFTCHNCHRHWPPAAIRVVHYHNRWWCDSCYRDTTGHPHT
jgi:hypothetical protein